METASGISVLPYYRITILPIIPRDLSPILSGGNERPPARDGDPREFLSLAVLLSDYKETERDRETHPERVTPKQSNRPETRSLDGETLSGETISEREGNG